MADANYETSAPFYLRAAVRVAPGRLRVSCPAGAIARAVASRRVRRDPLLPPPHDNTTTLSSDGVGSAIIITVLIYYYYRYRTRSFRRSEFKSRVTVLLSVS